MINDTIHVKVVNANTDIVDIVELVCSFSYLVLIQNSNKKRQKENESSTKNCSNKLRQKITEKES